MTVLSTTPRTFHVCPAVGYILNTPPTEAGMMLQDASTGRPLTSEEAKSLAAIAKAKGYEVVPMCKNHDARGLCLGHEIEE